MHGFLTPCANWARQHAEPTTFTANGSHSIYILETKKTKILKNVEILFTNSYLERAQNLPQFSTFVHFFNGLRILKKNVKVTMGIISIANRHFLGGYNTMYI